VLKEPGYTDICMGARNRFKAFYKYGDADGRVLRAKAKQLGTRLHMPVLWWTKGRVFRFLKKKGLFGSSYNCYKNTTDNSECDCKNSRIRRRFGDG
jgi:7-cyano-7-deazaguanine synthase in queuosine biosynthesis